MPNASTTRLLRRSGLLLVGAALATIGGGLTSEWLLGREMVRAAEEDLANLTRLFVQNSNDAIDVADVALVAARRLVEADRTPADLERTRDTLMVRDTTERSRELFVIGADASWLLQSSRFDPTGRDSAERSFFRYHQASRDRGLHIDHPIRSPATERWVLPLSRRIDNADGSFGGVVLGLIDLELLGGTYALVASEQRMAVSLTLTDGTLLVRQPFDPAEIGNKVVHQTQADSAGIAYRRSHLDGLDRIEAYRRSIRHPLWVATSVPAEDIRRT